MMKSRKPLLSTLTAGALLFAGSLIAQNTPAPPPPMPAPASTAADAAANQGQTPSAQTTQGQVTVASVPPPAPTIGPAPPFSQLSGGGKWITEDQAAAYPPLANDFIHADTNRDGKISKAEYERWTTMP